MSDNDRGAVAQGFLQRGLYEGLVLGVEVARGFVEDDDRRVLQEHAGDGETLLLAAGEAVAALAHDRGVAVGQRRDEIVDARRPARGDELGIRPSGRA